VSENGEVNVVGTLSSGVVLSTGAEEEVILKRRKLSSIYTK
jgi:hypothetical protein